MGQVRQVQKWQRAQKEKSADFKSPDLGSSSYTLIKYAVTMTQTNFFLFFAATADVYRNEGNEALENFISSMLFIFTLKELKQTAMRKN